MRLLHIADLHVGKRVCDFSMLEDQRHALAQVVAMLERGEADALLVAGDLYDKSQPSSEAVALVDWFLGAVASTGVPAIVIPGNHDSAERVAYAGGILATQGLHMAHAFDGRIEPVELADEFGPVMVWPIPFVRPTDVRHALPELPAGSYTEALRSLVSTLPLDPSVRNVAVVHQFVTATGVAPERTDSELQLGGMDNVDFEVFDAFDYVAVGHVHRPQRVGREAVRYAGSLLKYSVSEARYDKSVPLVTLGRKGSEPQVELTRVEPLHDMRCVRGPLERLISCEVVSEADPMDYLHVILTDEDEPINAMARLREVYPNVMVLSYDNARTKAAGLDPDARPAAADVASPMELFEEFYAAQNGAPLGDGQRSVVLDELQKIGVM